MNNITSCLWSLGLALAVSACGAVPQQEQQESVETSSGALEGAMDKKPIAAVLVPDLASSPNGPTIWLFVRGQNNELYRRVLRASGLVWLTDWQLVGGGVADIPTVGIFGTSSPYGVVSYVRGTDNHLWELYFRDARDLSDTGTWGDVSATMADADNLVGSPTVTTSGTRIAVLLQRREEPTMPEYADSVSYEWDHPYYPGQWSITGVSSRDNFNTFSVANGSFHVAGLNFRSYGFLYTRGFFSSTPDAFLEVTRPAIPLIDMGNSSIGLAVTNSAGTKRIWAFARTAGTIKTLTLNTDRTTSGWTDYPGGCTNAIGSPAVGTGNSSTPYAYSACGSNGLCVQRGGSCTQLFGALKSAPTVLTVGNQDLVFYKGSNNRVWMYTSSLGHKDLGRTLP